MDIDELLAQEHLVPSTLMHDARHCAYLDPTTAASSSSQGGTLPSQSRQQLPLWLASPLHQRNHISVEMPVCYGQDYREALRSDPAHMNLRDHSEYYFSVGVDMSRLLDDDLIELLGVSFNRRVQELVNTALNAGPRQDLSAVVSKLTLQEKQLLEAGREASNSFDKWRSRKAKMESSQLVGRKRAHPNVQRSTRAAARKSGA